MPNRREEKIQNLINRMTEYTPHAAALGLRVERVEDEKLTMRLPWQDAFIGDPTTGAAHNGLLIFLMEHTLGVATLCSDAMPPSLNPTLDLRVDHLGGSAVRCDIFATAWAYKVTPKVVSVEGIAWCESPEHPIARATGSSVVMKELSLKKLGVV